MNSLQKLFPLIAIFLAGVLPQCLYSEGSKELYITTYNTGLYCCNDFVDKCNYPPQYNGTRSQFAVYGCNEEDRLYFITDDPAQTIYMGFNGSGAGTGNHIVFRIKDITGTIVYPEANLPTAGTGFISTIGNARIGPTQIYGAGGYSAIDWHPPVPGTYYIEFNKKNSGGTVVTGSFNIDLFDITVYDTVATQLKPGRLFSKAWQFTESSNCSATTYVYSNDSIITSATFNDMNGGTWIQFCNPWGCQNTGNFDSDRKSLYHPTTATYLPEYKIFINSPDAALFPPATTLGQIIPPAPWGEQLCSNGHIIFHVTVDKPGNAEILLTFSPPYVSRKLASDVIYGENLIEWDGLDGSTPAGIPVPYNINVTFTVSYINGLTNMPFFDVEGNPNGFAIDIIAPTGAAPMVYWDDTDIPSGGSNLTGCLSPPGCHTWNSSWGNINTVNTWWYNVSASTTALTYQEKRYPDQPGTITGPDPVCPGSTGNIYWIHPSTYSNSHNWIYSGTGTTMTQINDTTIQLDFANNATSGNITVNGINVLCGSGPVQTKVITVSPAPVVSLTFPDPDACTNDPPFALTGGMPAGGTYTMGGLPVTTFSPSVQGSGTFTITYTYTDPVTSCTAFSNDDIVVHSAPIVTFPSPAAVCISAAPFPLLGGTPAGGVYTGTGVTAGYFYPSVAGAGTIPLTYTYTDANNCTNVAGSSILVNSLPVISFPALSPVCITSPPFQLTGATPSGGTYKGDGVTGSTFNPAIAGTGIHTIKYIYTDLNGCSDSTTQNITVNPIPGTPGAISGTPVLCQGASSIGYSVPVIADAATYVWLLSPAAAGTITGSSANILISWSASFYGSAILTVTGVNPCGNGPASQGYTVTIRPNPVVSLSQCYDSVTTTSAKPFFLRGGSPPGGTYSGTGVSSATSSFNPYFAGTGSHPVTYLVINSYGCSGSAQKTITVVNPAMFTCGSPVKDIRDNRQYNTVFFDPQCWMAENLNYGKQISGTTNQRDNCSVEKYCYNDATANCSTSGGLYQWDELMQYGSSTTGQGLCMPGWHVPSEAEWNVLFSNYTNNGFAAIALKSTGYSGYNALLKGTGFGNSLWTFVNFATLFWSSDSHGPLKAWAHGMNSYNPSVSYYPASRSDAFSVRCLKD